MAILKWLCHSGYWPATSAACSWLYSMCVDATRHLCLSFCIVLGCMAKSTAKRQSRGHKHELSLSMVPAHDLQAACPVDNHCGCGSIFFVQALNLMLCTLLLLLEQACRPIPYRPQDYAWQGRLLADPASTAPARLALEHTNPHDEPLQSVILAFFRKSFHHCSSWQAHANCHMVHPALMAGGCGEANAP